MRASVCSKTHHQGRHSSQHCLCNICSKYMKAMHNVVLDVSCGVRKGGCEVSLCTDGHIDIIQGCDNAEARDLETQECCKITELSRQIVDAILELSKARLKNLVEALEMISVCGCRKAPTRLHSGPVGVDTLENNLRRLSREHQYFERLNNQAVQYANG